MNKVLFIAPHPDDETLSCAGTILRHRRDGDEIHWLIMTTISESAGYTAERVISREKEIAKVSKAYSFDEVHRMKYIATTLDTIPRVTLIDEISKIIHRIKPQIIYLPYRGDIHSDHQVVFDTVASCTKSFRYPSIRRVRVYETLSETEFGIRTDDMGFRPNLWIDISDFIDKKIEIMRLYKNEINEHPFPRSERNMRSLATLRGATVSCEAAEAFMQLKDIVKDE